MHASPLDPGRAATRLACLCAAVAATFSLCVPAASAQIGALTQTGCLAAGGINVADCDVGRVLVGATDVVLSPDGEQAYVIASGDSGIAVQGAIAIFDRDPASGELTQKPGAQGCMTDDGSRARASTARTSPTPAARR